MSGQNSATDEPLLRVENLVRTFHGAGFGAPSVQAVAGVSFDLHHGETLAIVGETGSGKSTLARSILQIPAPSSGRVIFQGRELTGLRGRALRDARDGAQLVFQDPASALDSRWTIARSVEEPLRSGSNRQSSAQRRRTVDELLDLVGLEPQRFAGRYPRELSGGQLQRAVIARAIAHDPVLLVCDEPVSALDVSVQAQILNLFESLREKLHLSYIFVSHDLSVVRHVSDRVAVLYLGRIAEIGETDQVFTRPAHPYTRALLDSVPGADETRERIELRGDLPSPSNPPSGCRVRTRCPFAQEVCAQEQPELRSVDGTERMVACHFPLTIGHAADLGLVASTR